MRESEPLADHNMRGGELTYANGREEELLACNIEGEEELELHVGLAIGPSPR